MKRLVLIIMVVIPMVCFGQSDDMYFNPAKDKLKSFGLYEKGIHWWCGEKVIITVDGDTKPYEKLFKPYGAEYLSKHMESIYVMWLEHLSECEIDGCSQCKGFKEWVSKKIDILKELYK